MDSDQSDTNTSNGSQTLEGPLPNFNLKGKLKRKRLSEFNEFKEEVRAMIKSITTTNERELKKVSATLAEIKSTNSSIESSIAFLTSQNEELKNKLEQLQIKEKKDTEYIILLEEKIEDIQRANRKANIEIKNVPKQPSETKEDLIRMVSCLSDTINCKMQESDIRDIYRVRPKKDGQKSTPIIVETASTILKTNMIKMSKLYNSKHKSKLCARDLGLRVNESTPVYISEQLTTRGARLYFLARELTRTKAYKFCWTAYGRVYVRKTENSPIIIIKSEAQVQQLSVVNNA